MSKKLTEEQRKKLRQIVRKRCPAISEGMKGHAVSEETREKLSKAMKGRKITWGHKISESLRGRHGRAEQLAQARAAWWASLSEEERAERIAKWQKAGANAPRKTRKGQKLNLTPEQRKAISRRNRELYASMTPEERSEKYGKATAEANRRRTQSPETRAKLSQIAKERHAQRKEWEVQGTAPHGTGFVPFSTFGLKRKKARKKRANPAE